MRVWARPYLFLEKEAPPVPPSHPPGLQTLPSSLYSFVLRRALPCTCRENAAGCQCCGFSCFYGVSRCLLPRPQRCEAAFLLASVGREIPAGAEAA